GGSAPRTAPIAHAVFQEIGIVRVTRAKLVLDVPIILGPRVDILDLQRDWRAGGDLFAVFGLEHAGQDLDRVRLLPLGGVFRLAGLALVQIGLDLCFGDGNARRAAV